MRFLNVCRCVLLSNTQSKKIAISALRKTDQSPASRQPDLSRFLPSNNFLKSHVRKPSHRRKLASLVSELQIFIESFGDSTLSRFDDAAWKIYFRLYSPKERCDFLAEMMQHESGVPGPAPKISEVNSARYESGEMVYAPGFHNLLELRGAEFRRVIDRMYGSRLLSTQRCDEGVPKLVIDTRFLREFSGSIQSQFTSQIQDLYEGNWASRRPFDISIANFQPDAQLAAFAKRHWLFHYGPPSSSGAYVRHPFSPSITSKGVVHAASCDPAQVVYVSWRAPRPLPSDPSALSRSPSYSHVKAVVLCTSNDFQPWSSGVSAAAKDHLPVYRIPVEQFVRFSGQRRVLSLRQSADVLRAYFAGDDIGEPIRNAFSSRKKTRSEQSGELRRKMKEYREAIEEISRIESESEERGGRQRGDGFERREKRTRSHSYSRDDRREMRTAL